MATTIPTPDHIRYPDLYATVRNHKIARTRIYRAVFGNQSLNLNDATHGGHSQYRSNTPWRDDARTPPQDIPVNDIYTIVDTYQNEANLSREALNHITSRLNILAKHTHYHCRYALKAWQDGTFTIIPVLSSKGDAQ